MSTQNIPTDYRSFAANLDATIATTRRRNALSLGASLVSLALLGYWLTAAYAKFSTVDPDLAASYGVSVFEAHLPQTSAVVQKRLIDAAPQVVAAAEKRLAGLPDSIAARLKTRTDAELELALPKLEEELYGSLKTALTQATGQIGKGKSDAVYARQLIDTLADTYQTETTRLIDTVHDRYTAIGGDTLSYLDYLAEGKDLDKTEQLHREMLTTFLTIAARQRVAETEGDAPVTPVIPGTPAKPVQGSADVK